MYGARRVSSTSAVLLKINVIRFWKTVTEPDMIQEGDLGQLLAIRFNPETPLTSKLLVAAYREVSAEDGFILTAYLTSRPSAGRMVIWKR
jgi:hypothetical protein